MLAVFARPAPLLLLTAGAFAVCFAIALYCLAYSALAGRPESLSEAFAWAAVNVLPWLLAVEAAKRRTAPAEILLILATAMLGSLLLGAIAAGASPDLAFEAIRRIPGLLLAAGLIVLIRWAGRRQVIRSAETVDLPLAPEQIDWVNAAGNYIEIRGSGRIVVRRASLGAAERALQGHGFVRVHRSILVRRASIARVRPADILLRDGTNLKTGKRYRSALSD